MEDVSSGQPPIFVVTSGRSGSTLLARLLHAHPEVTVVSDLFEPAGPMPYLDPARVVTGGEFWETLAAPTHPERIRYWRQQPTDELLHLPAEDDQVSLLACYTLPFLAGGDLGPLVAEAERAVRGFPRASMPRQLLRFFAWLRDRHGGTRWVERTGGSLPHAPALVNTFGQSARFIHLHRDPRETAISMTTGSFFRLYLALSSEPHLADDRWTGCDDPVAMGEMVTSWELAAAKAFTKVASERVHRIAYERLLSSPTRVLCDLAEFILERPAGDRDEDWARTQASEVRAAPQRRHRLPSEVAAALHRACEPALEVLGRA